MSGNQSMIFRPSYSFRSLQIAHAILLLSCSAALNGFPKRCFPQSFSASADSRSLRCFGCDGFRPNGLHPTENPSWVIASRLQVVYSILLFAKLPFTFSAFLRVSFILRANRASDSLHSTQNLRTTGISAF